MDFVIAFTFALLCRVVIYAQANGKSSNVVFLKAMTWLGIIRIRWLALLYDERYYGGPVSNILVAYDGGSDILQAFAERCLTIQTGNHVSTFTRKSGRVSGLSADRESDLNAILRCDRGMHGSAITLIDEEIAVQTAFSVS